MDGLEAREEVEIKGGIRGDLKVKNNGRGGIVRGDPLYL